MKIINLNLKKKIFASFFIAIFSLGLISPIAVFAEEGFVGQLAPATCGNTGQKECGWGDFIGFINRLLKFAIYLATMLGVVAFCYAGFLYLTAFGEMGKIEEAHKIFKTVLVGLFFVLLGWLIVATILKTLGVEDKFTMLDGVSSVETIQAP